VGRRLEAEPHPHRRTPGVTGKLLSLCDDIGQIRLTEREAPLDPRKEQVALLDALQPLRKVTAAVIHDPEEVLDHLDQAIVGSKLILAELGHLGRRCDRRVAGDILNEIIFQGLVKMIQGPFGEVV
jgi:hypothetical protein